MSTPTTDALTVISRTQVFDGELIRYQHQSHSLQCPMIFSVFLPATAKKQPVPTLYWLSGLTCTDENFMQKAGAQRVAAELGIALIAPDTSPRGLNLPGEDESYDLGSGAGFYLNATQTPWQGHYNMYDYVTAELPALAQKHLPITDIASISGHSMGGHGALICGLKKPELYRSISAFAPICNPINAPWGIKAFTAYLGEDQTQWQAYDATTLLQNSSSPLPILIDQGLEDEFLENQLGLPAFESVANEKDASITIQQHAHYDHSYYFIASFIESHLRFHAAYLKG